MINTPSQKKVGTCIHRISMIQNLGPVPDIVTVGLVCRAMGITRRLPCRKLNRERA